MNEYVVIDEHGGRFTYEAEGPQSALERHYALDTDGEQPLVLSVFVAGMEIISREQAEEWAGRKLSDEEVERLSDAIPFSSIPDAIDTIVNSWED